MLLEILLSASLASVDAIPPKTDDALVSWTEEAMKKAQPSAPWQETYHDTAGTFVKLAKEAPLFAGVHGVRRTLSLLVSVAWFEGRFDPKAKGDCLEKDKKGRCIARPQSLCMFQIGRSNLKYLETTEEEILESTEVCTRAAMKMMKISFNVCRGRNEADFLGHYAAGGDACGGPKGEGLRESGHRMLKAKWIFDHVPLKE